MIVTRGNGTDILGTMLESQINAASDSEKQLD